jgi:hypothetical protein
VDLDKIGIAVETENAAAFRSNLLGIPGWPAYKDDCRLSGFFETGETVPDLCG